MLDPQGTMRWITQDQVEAAQAAGGTLVNADNSFAVTPAPGESFADTMARAARIGKTVSPQLISQQAVQGIRDTPLALGAAATAGVAGPATLAGVGAAGSALSGLGTSALNAGSLLLQSPVVQQGIRMLGMKALGGAATAVGMGGGYALLKKLGLFKPAAAE
jgi:hypothetical protein